MAAIFHQAVGNRWLDLWYHFAIMFEALFILTTLDAGTRVGRYLLQDVLGNLWKPLGDVKEIKANILASGLMVAGWGYFLIQGVRDPLGGINSLWPLFGIANQLLASIALCLATTVILKLTLVGAADSKSAPAATQRAGPQFGVRGRSPALALVTLVPLVWLLSVTMTAGAQKIFHPDPKIGFLAAAKGYSGKIAEADPASGLAKSAEALSAAQKALQSNKRLFFNNMLDAFVAGTFLVLVVLLVAVCVREWILLLARRKRAELRESQPVWLPDYAVAEGGRRIGSVGQAAALTVALAKQLSGEADLERARQQAASYGQCEPGAQAAGKIYEQVTEQRFNGVRRCC